MSLNTSISDVFPQKMIEAAGADWNLSGEGVFSWSVFKLYRARLFVSGQCFDAKQPFVLDLSYLRTLSAQQIVSTSMDELKRLRDPSAQALIAWSQALMNIVPDVTLGDRLIGWFRPGTGVQFYSSTQSLGSVNDPVFSEAFAAIWLDVQTRSPGLRLALLGNTCVTPSVGS